MTCGPGRMLDRMGLFHPAQQIINKIICLRVLDRMGQMDRMV
jgi:hypothetical protein